MSEVPETASMSHRYKYQVCHECIGDEYLKKVVTRCGKDGMCTYCGKVARVITLENLAKHIERFFDDHFVDDRASQHHPKFHVVKKVDKRVDVIIKKYAKVDIEIAQDLQMELRRKYFNPEDERMGNENPFDERMLYNRKATSEGNWNSIWRELRKSIVEENRMFNVRAIEILNSVFGGNVICDNEENKELSNIVEVGPCKKISSLFRAREFQSDEKLYTALCHPDRELGPPPSSHATAGRMNAEGVAVFYGATRPKVAIAEIRPAVGSRVLVGRFEITRNLKLLNVVKLRSLVASGVPESYFRPSKKRILEKIEFLSNLCERISAPVVPQDEAADYLVTQAISDYLSELDRPTPIDGLIYDSAQTGSKTENVVLFHNSSRVEYRRKPKGTEACELHHDFFGSEVKVEYVVYETKGVEDMKDNENVDCFDYDKRHLHDKREASLKLDCFDISIHLIKRVKFKTGKQEISRQHAGIDTLFDDWGL